MNTQDLIELLKEARLLCDLKGTTPEFNAAIESLSQRIDKAIETYEAYEKIKVGGTGNLEHTWWFGNLDIYTAEPDAYTTLQVQYNRDGSWISTTSVKRQIRLLVNSLEEAKQTAINAVRLLR